jgi:hypothetical protein
MGGLGRPRQHTFGKAVTDGVIFLTMVTRQNVPNKPKHKLSVLAHGRKDRVISQVSITCGHDSFENSAAIVNEKSQIVKTHICWKRRATKDFPKRTLPSFLTWSPAHTFTRKQPQRISWGRDAKDGPKPPSRPTKQPLTPMPRESGSANDRNPCIHRGSAQCNRAPSR